LIVQPPQDVRKTPKPPWLKVAFPSHADYFSVSSLIEGGGLHTICRSARCPNIAECWTRRTATFLILGAVCTRACAFCAVEKGAPEPPDPAEPERVAEAAAALKLAYAVVTSVTRDDLADGGAGQFVETVRALRRRLPDARIEVLVPDFGGRPEPLAAVLAERPDVLNHNLETIERLYPAIARPRANYRRSLEVLRRAKDAGATTKSGLMVGLGETPDEVLRAFADLRDAGCDLLTLGQYLQPTRSHAKAERYVPPAEFDRMKAEALDLGIAGVEAGPLVRSSFHAHELYANLPHSRKEPACGT
jgi:lipoic acid synthetase